MATLTEIVNRKGDAAVASQQIADIAEIVTKAREEYGNTDAEVSTTKVNTCDGMVDLKYLSDSDKVAVAAGEIARIRVQAIEAVECTEGANLAREVERLVAVNPVLTNITTASESEYI